MQAEAVRAAQLVGSPGPWTPPSPNGV